LDLDAKDIFGFYIVETLVYCMVNYINIKTRLILPIVSIIMIYFTIMSIISPENYSYRWISFIQYSTILVIFYSISLFIIGDKFYEIEEETFKKNMVVKFLVLFSMTIVGAILYNIIRNDIAFLISMYIIKNIIDLYAYFRFTKNANLG